MDYQLEEARFVDQNGRKNGGFSTDVFRRMTNGRFTSLRRSDLSAVIYEALGIVSLSIPEINPLRLLTTIIKNTITAILFVVLTASASFCQTRAERIDLLVKNKRWISIEKV